ncbi:MAG: hypothetical protein KGL35_05660 [Bradyrhizobium sp.]|uniref:hypothetical protein n=1 Tax=Bradyrhizobium sp. TaxID=376 RepID=UPI001C28C7B0|nr:hypothetical protein [Bradyrhizobium sp.]MBU6461199.1 hypothetical protein [Pseudomonadota bacterium]MDE2066275.1 hypothetical protein [Bradyrhizobium sp.]MDE2468226.1 hypothetical protein [Bradyrhizobium sp.]
MKWAKERDDLIAQTKAFVRSVTDGKPELAAEPLEAEPLRAQKSFFAASPPSAPPVFVPSIESTAPTDAAPLPKMRPVRAPSQDDVRKEIQSRVAAFQAHQHRFQREREAYFKSVLTKVRSVIEGGSDASSR